MASLVKVEQRDQTDRRQGASEKWLGPLKGIGFAEGQSGRIPNEQKSAITALARATECRLLGRLPAYAGARRTSA